LSEIIERTNERTVKAKSEDGKFYVETLFHDDEALRQNDRIRSSGMLDKGKLGLHENEDYRAVISIPDVLQWNIFKKKHNDTYKLLTIKGTTLADEALRAKGITQLDILHPGWVIYKRL